MSRCKCCDRMLSEIDVKTVQPDGSEEDMCMRCVGHSYSEFCYTYDHEFVMETAREGITSVCKNSE
jgi:hypothetical protein